MAITPVCPDQDRVAQSETKVRQRIDIGGVVQGVGFRPFVYNLATDLALAGFVGNASHGVFIEVEGQQQTVEMFSARLQSEIPPLATIEKISFSTIPPIEQRDFIIVQSRVEPTSSTFISPDLCICDDCLQELLDPTNRRYRYPFINCTNCGPRFTITKDIPYDRPLTTMSEFSMCSACQTEYEDPRNRRFHAQPNGCSVCGPNIWFQLPMENGQHLTKDQAIHGFQKMIQAGGIVGIKGLGGFHLACDATNDEAVRKLRERKGRAGKPFAVMTIDEQAAREISYISNGEEAQLTSPVRPIVLLEKRPESPLSNLVAPGNGYIGVMLPYTPLHYLFFQHFDKSSNPTTLQSCNFLLMTSGNLSSEPIVIHNSDALDRLSPLVDGFLLHNRPIHLPCDDSVIRVFQEVEYPIRRSRGYAPFPIKLPFPVKPTLAVGGELKNTFCLAHGRYGFMSQHIGDMENWETLQAFEEAATHFTTIFRNEPEVLVCDMHPSYLSSRWADSYQHGDRETKALVKAQHHHAHIASVMAEHGLAGSEPVIGISFDGTGYGPDDTIWGGEILVADYGNYCRAAHLTYVPLPGGDTAVKHPARTALAHLWAAGVAWDEGLPPVRATSAIERGIIQRQLERSLNTIPTSSMGRLFDAVAALAGVLQSVTYEGQAAIELESICDLAASGLYSFAWSELESDNSISIEAGTVIEAVVTDVLMGVPASVISARFHRAVTTLIVDLSMYLRTVYGLNRVALSGGVFQNMILLESAVEQLQKNAFEVLIHQKVPPNDGGLALGQVLIANAQYANV